MNSSPVPAQLRSGFRDALKIIGTALASKGVFDESYPEIALGLVMFIAPVVWSQFSARAKHKKIVALKEQAQVAELDLSQCP